MPSADASYDVVVVGARVAGAATAHVLAGSGLRVLLVDRGRPGTDTMSTHALMRGGVVQLARWGLLDRIVAAGTPPIRTTTFRYGGEVLPIRIKPGGGVDALYAPRRTVLDPIMVRAAEESGADVRFGVTVTDVLDDGAGGVGGVVAHTEGGRSTIGTRLVVGADGIRSTVARLVDAPLERVGTGASAVTYGYWTGLETDGYEWNFRPAAASGVIPTNGGAAGVFVAAPPARLGRGGPATFAELLAESEPTLAARVRAAKPASALRTFTGRPGHVRRSYGPGWALVGDAGYFKDPLSAHGITDALRDAELLARAVRRWLVDGDDGPSSLAGYQALRDELSADLFEVTDVIAGHRWRDAEIGQLLLRLNAAMTAELEVLAALPVSRPADPARRCASAA